MPANGTRTAVVCAAFTIGMLFVGCAAHVGKIKVDAPARFDAAAQRTAYSIRELSAPASPLPIDAMAGKKNVRTAFSARGID